MSKNPAEIRVQYIKGVGPKRAALLTRLGINTAQDALLYLPHRYEDRRNISSISELYPVFHPSGKNYAETAGQDISTVTGTVIAKNDVFTRRGPKIFELTVSDGTGAIKAKWFNQPYMKQRFKKGDEIVISGIVRPGYKGVALEIDNPEYEILTGEDKTLIKTAGVTPVYPATEGLSSKQLRRIIRLVLDEFGDLIEDPLPEELLSRLGLPELGEAVRFVHGPPNDSDIGLLNSMRSPSQRRIVFDELLLLQLGLLAMKKNLQREKGISFGPNTGLIERLRQNLPFKLTGAQETALSGILADMKAPHPMNRLLQGDVGSGKTVVAAMAMLFAIESGYQTALMSPTEILAEQHFANISAMAEPLGIKTALFTGSVKKRQTEGLKDGSVKIAVGTHALIEERVEFQYLGLAVIDEQHRFGVRQRALLRQKAHNPDVLVMTATPIPRTLAMTLYGDLDVSVISSLPPGRTPIETKIVMEARKAEVYSIIDAEVRRGGQAYVVYPVIEESELKSVIQGRDGLKKIFPHLRVGLVHGRLKPSEKEKEMEDFKRGRTHILAATTVIEVGVDIPNASLMVIVHAERFGLSQLHQLRGRVGRGQRESRCIMLAYGDPGEEALSRLRVMEETTDGFRIAEEDLSLRGPGDVMGTRQSGLPDLKTADLGRDVDILRLARDEAVRMMDEDPLLEKHKLLRERTESFWEGKAELFRTA